MRGESPPPDNPVPLSSPLSSPAHPEPTAKPKSAAKSKAKEPDPSPEPPPRPPPRTIRLEITLGGPDNYAVDIAQLAKATGQRPPTPQEVVKPDSSDSEPEKSNEKSEKKRKKRKNMAHEYYDTTDPFIDDSELAIDERKWFAQTKQQGFYVSSGEVALLKDASPKKPRSKKPPISLATPVIKIEPPAEGTRESPIALISDNEGDAPNTSKSVKTTSGSGDEDVKTGQKRKRYLTVVENGKKRKVVDVTSFNPELQASLEKLKEAIAQESWESKGKFPPSIKPLLASVALQAIKLDEYDEHFFNLMPTLFPYNKFTMMKLIKRTIFPDHIALLNERSDTLLAELKRLADEGFNKAEEEWEKSVLAWDKRQEKARVEAATNGTGSIQGEDSSAPTRHGTEEIPEGEENKESTVKETPAAHPPAKKYRMTESMKNIVWELVQISNECCRLENEKNSLEGSVLQVSEQGLRKILYQKVVAAFPEGWMNSGQISRDVSAMKKKYEKEAMENE